MDKSDFAHLSRCNDKKEAVKWGDFLDFTPLPPFGALSSDMSKRFMRAKQRPPVTTQARSQLHADTTADGSLPFVKPNQDASPKSSVEPSFNSSTYSRPGSFSPVGEYLSAKQPLSGNERNDGTSPFQFHPRLPSAPTFCIGERVKTPKSKLTTPGPAITAGGYRQLSKTKSAPQFTFGMKCPQHSAVQPSVTGAAGIGLSHDDVTGTIGASTADCTFGIRHVDPTKRTYDTPISYDWKTDEERRRTLVNTDKSKVKFGIRLPGSEPRNVSPGPAAYYPQPSPIASNTNPDFDKLGRKLPALTATLDGPGPGDYDPSTAWLNTASSAPAFSLKGRPKSSSGSGHVQHGDAMAGIHMSFANTTSTVASVDMRLNGIDFPTKRRAPTWRFGTSARPK